MNIFIDTEFTDFTRPELISIGLVSDDGREFYAEHDGFNRAACSNFVQTVVLPQLGKKPACVFSRTDLRDALRSWITQFEHDDPIVCFDFEWDWTFFCAALNHDVPPWIKNENVYLRIDDLQVEHFFMKNDIADHHALHDAYANRFACRPSDRSQWA